MVTMYNSSLVQEVMVMSAHNVVGGGDLSFYLKIKGERADRCS
ncbi:MAG: hypothetical protein ACP5OH_04835 [Nitrososphaerota archaeon]